MIKYPCTLPEFRMGKQRSEQQTFRTTQVFDGQLFVEKVTDQSPVVWNVTITCPDRITSRQFKSFVNSVCSGEPFQKCILTEEGFIDHEVRFQQLPLSPTQLSETVFEYTGSIYAVALISNDAKVCSDDLIANFLPQAACLDFMLNGNANLIAYVDSLLTFSRSTVATVVGAQGVLIDLGIDEPAFKGFGFYPEGEATNLTTFSEDINNWSKDALATMVSNGIGPDNISVPIEFTTDVGSSAIWDWGPTATVSFTIGETYTFSFFVMDNGGQFVAINLPDAEFGTDSDVSFDLVNGVVGNNQGSKPAEIEEVLNAPGWFRISMTLVCTASGSATADLIAVIGGGTSLTTTGDGTGFFSFGAQTLLRDYKSKYISTNGSTVTRANEICTVFASEFLTNAKDNFTLITNVFIERLSGSTSASDRQTIVNALSNENLNLFISDDDILFFNGNQSDGQGTYGVTASNVLTTGYHEIIAVRRSSTAIEIWLDGVMVVENTSNIAPTDPDYTNEFLNIGSRTSTEDRFLNIPTNNMAIYNRALSMAEISAGSFIDADILVPLDDDLTYSTRVI